MKAEIKKEILFDLEHAMEILQSKDPQDIPKLRKLSEHAIEDVALHKNLDLISVTVLLYSIYKISHGLSKEDYKDLLKELQFAKDNLTRNNLGRYNTNIKTLFNIVRRCNAKVKEHFQDVMHAARIKKGTALLQKGLSIGQAAGLMGLSNWDLQQYAGKTVALQRHHEKVPAKRRLLTALKIFGVK